MPPVLNPVSYDGARVLEASGRPIYSLVDSSNQVEFRPQFGGFIDRGVYEARKLNT